MNLMLRAKDTGKLNIDRVFARLLVLLGGVFWVAALFGGNVKANYEQFVYTLPEFAQASLLSLVPLAIVVVVFVLGWFYERLTGYVLLAVALAMLLWGVIAHGTEFAADTVLWTTAVAVLVAPSAFAGVLYLLAASTQEVQELIAEKQHA